MQTKTILIITDNTPNQINGVVTTYKNLEKYAFEKGYNVTYITPDDFYNIDCPFYKEIKLSLPISIGRRIEEINPDFIHLATEGPVGISAKIFLDKNLYKYNTAYHTNFPEGLKKIIGIPEKVSWPLIRWFHKHSGKVLTTTNSMVNYLKQNGVEGEILPWTRGVDRSIFDISLRQDIKNIQPVILCVSRISKEKNLEDFFKLDYPNSRKIMVGDGPMKCQYESMYPDVEFVGLKTGKDLAQYYANADVFVFPSKWDTFGIVMIESMACGTPVAAYPCNGPLDVIDNGITGYMEESLYLSVHKCLKLSSDKVEAHSRKWSWEEAWNIFETNLVPSK